jgi:hypothetical protein
VANRTAQTPVLLQEVDRRAAARPTAFTLLVPDTSSTRADWTLEEALRELQKAARGPAGLRRAHVDGMVGGKDAFHSVKQALEGGSFDEVLISTLPERDSVWLREELPRNVARLGVEVTVITPPRPTRRWLMRFVLPDRFDGRDG